MRGSDAACLRKSQNLLPSELRYYDLKTVKDILDYETVKNDIVDKEDIIFHAIGMWVKVVKNPHHVIDDWLDANQFPVRLGSLAKKICSLLCRETSLGSKYSPSTIAAYCIKQALTDIQFGTFKKMLNRHDVSQLLKIKADDSVQGLDLKAFEDNKEYVDLQKFLDIYQTGTKIVQTTRTSDILQDAIGKL